MQIRKHANLPINLHTDANGTIVDHSNATDAVAVNLFMNYNTFLRTILLHIQKHETVKIIMTKLATSIRVTFATRQKTI